MLYMLGFLSQFTFIIRVHGALIVIIFCILVIIDRIKIFGGFRNFIKFVLSIEESCEGEGH